MTRRTLLGAASAAVASATASDWLASPPAAQPVHPLFPTQEPDLVREMVAVSHGNVQRVRELLAARPALARAAWDWGFGDWESALGAASHVGHREIAELLIAHGARPSIFSAAMLGQVEVVRAFVAASPGVQRIKGPHGITLLAHAQAGGAAAQPVAAYLEALGDADLRPALVPLSGAERDRLVGLYAFGPGESERFEVAVDRGQLGLARTGGARRGLFHLGGNEFFPAGAEAVRIRFTVEDERAVALAVHDPGLVLEARRLA
jgi:hypothetical protein